MKHEQNKYDDGLVVVVVLILLLLLLNKAFTFVNSQKIK